MGHLSKNTQINTTNVHVFDSNAFVARERELLFQMGDQLSGIYKVNSGCVKVFRSTRDGEKQIIGFYMAGDYIGLDALADGYSYSTAQVLEAANISLIPFDSILNKDEKFDHQAFIHQLGVKHKHENDLTLMLSQPANKRIAWFLVKHSDHLAKRGMSATKFRIPMTGTDIALYLGMALETFSRELGSFCKQGIILKNNKNIEILDIETLRQSANGDNYLEEDFSKQIKQFALN